LTIGASGGGKFRTSSLEAIKSLPIPPKAAMVVHKPELQASLPLRSQKPQFQKTTLEDETIETLSFRGQSQVVCSAQLSAASKRIEEMLKWIAAVLLVM